MSLKQAIEKLSCLVQHENGKDCLNHKHDYCAQIKGQMAILDIEMLVEEVAFNSVFLKACQAKLETFYDNISAENIDDETFVELNFSRSGQIYHLQV